MLQTRLFLRKFSVSAAQAVPITRHEAPVITRTVTTPLAERNDFTPRSDWTREEIQEVFEMPLMDLVSRASTIHRANFPKNEVQMATLLSIKTGGCSENCGYCSQSQHHKTFVKPTKTVSVEEVVEAAKRAKANGSTRFCLGSAWREVGNKHAFKKVLQMVKEVNSLEMEVCTTLGMLTEEQAVQLKEAGLYAYNHNLDTSREFYPKVVTTRTYDDRLETISNVQKAGLSVCCGGIIGLGEQSSDRVGLLMSLATMEKHPDSVPVNALVAVEGTPIGDEMKKQGYCPQWDEMVRMVATARVVLPKSVVRLSAGRKEFSEAEQALMFMSGANSIFSGDTLLTTSNPLEDQDKKLFNTLGIKPKPLSKSQML